MTVADPTGRILIEIRDDAAVAALTTRVRCPKPMGKQVNAAGVVTDKGDARGPGEWIRFVVITRLGRSRLKHAPLQEVRYIAKCYGQGGNPAQDADLLAATVSDALHTKGRRISAGGVSIFDSFDDGEEGATDDPDTGQPHSDVIFSVNALTSLVP